MEKRFSIVLLCLSLGFIHCGGALDTSGAGEAGVTVNLVIENPSPDAIGTAKAVDHGSDFSLGKGLESSTISQCTITATAPGKVSQSKTVDVASGASTIEVSLSLTTSSNWTICADCSDTSATSNNVTEGFNGCAEGVSVAKATDTASISAKFKNLAASSSDVVKYIRIKQDSKTQGAITVGFANALTDAEKATVRCLIELDPTGSRTTMGAIDSSASLGLVTTKSDYYAEVKGGVGSPKCSFFNSSDTLLTKSSGTWGSNSKSNTEAACQLSVRQMRSLLDNDRKGQYAVLCSLTGASPWTVVPANGKYAKYDLSAGGDTDRTTLVSNGGSCNSTSNGLECASGYCSPGGTCISWTAASLSGVVTNVVGPAEGTTTSGTTDGVGSDARFNAPNGICLSPDSSTLYVLDLSNRVIRKVVISSGTVTTFAGDGTIHHVDGTGTSAGFGTLGGCVVDPLGVYMYATDRVGSVHTIRKINLSTAEVTTLAGGNVTGGLIDGTGTAASFSGDVMHGITIDHAGANLYVTDGNNNAIRKITTAGGVVTTIAGNGNASRGDADGTGTSAKFASLGQIAIDSTDSKLYVAQRPGITATAGKIRQIVLATGVVTTIASLNGFVATSDASTGASASFNGPFGIAIDPTDSVLYVSETEGAVIRKLLIRTSGLVQSIGTTSTLAGGSATDGDSNATGTSARFSTDGTKFLTLNHLGTILYVSDPSKNKIRQVK
ncbi:MAG: hypothetical protein Q7T03_09610 [Deltaproteobacteria bacterium]|nr:hypothetical protein [Deltaproteobacteria bacterium]